MLLCSKNRASPACMAHSTRLPRGSNTLHGAVSVSVPMSCPNLLAPVVRAAVAQGTAREPTPKPDDAASLALYPVPVHTALAERQLPRQLACARPLSFWNMCGATPPAMPSPQSSPVETSVRTPSKAASATHPAGQRLQVRLQFSCSVAVARLLCSSPCGAHRSPNYCTFFCKARAYASKGQHKHAGLSLLAKHCTVCCL